MKIFYLLFCSSCCERRERLFPSALVLLIFPIRTFLLHFFGADVWRTERIQINFCSSLSTYCRGVDHKSFIVNLLKFLLSTELWWKWSARFECVNDEGRSWELPLNITQMCMRQATLAHQRIQCRIWRFSQDASWWSLIKSNSFAWCHHKFNSSTKGAKLILLMSWKIINIALMIIKQIYATSISHLRLILRSTVVKCNPWLGSLIPRQTSFFNKKNEPEIRRTRAMSELM